MSNLPDRFDSPRWPADEPERSGIDWCAVVVMVSAAVTGVGYVGLILWLMGMI